MSAKVNQVIALRLTDNDHQRLSDYAKQTHQAPAVLARRIVLEFLDQHHISSGDSHA